jgi:toxin ParE1/3/4
MRRVIWSDEATDNAEAIFAYVSAFSLPAARRLNVRLVAAAASFAEMPDRGRAWRGGIRDLLAVEPYIIRYVVVDDEVRILKIRHGAQRPER